MEMFPDRSVQEIVDGLEAAVRVLKAICPPGRYKETWSAEIQAEINVINHAAVRVANLRNGRFIPPAAPAQELPDAE